MKVWCAVSGHGYGHLAQIAPVLNELAARVPALEVCVAGVLPSRLLAKRLRCRYRQVERPQDVGLVQPDPLRVDRDATAAALQRMHGDWVDRVRREAAAIAATSPDLVLADVPYLAIAAAGSLGVPAVAIASLSWDQVLQAYFSIARQPASPWWRDMRVAYAQARLAVLPTPAIESDTFPRVAAVPPIVTPGRQRRRALRDALQIDSTDSRPLALVSLGGIPCRDLPLRALRADTRFLWLVDGDPVPPAPNLFALRSLAAWDYGDVFASVDVAVGKPGYNTAVESVASRVPLLYVRRGRFPDEEPICRWLADHGQAAEIPRSAFQSGHWGEFLEDLLRQPTPASTPLDGAAKAVEAVLTALG